MLHSKLFSFRKSLVESGGVWWSPVELYQTPITWTKKSNWLSYSRIINWG